MRSYERTTFRSVWQLVTSVPPLSGLCITQALPQRHLEQLRCGPCQASLCWSVCGRSTICDILQISSAEGEQSWKTHMVQLLRGPFAAERSPYTLVVGYDNANSCCLLKLCLHRPRVFSQILTDDNEAQRNFMTLVRKATATILYRLDPTQKRELVRPSLASLLCLYVMLQDQAYKVVLKRKFLHGTTVAIGDGGNDTQMLAASDLSFAIARENSEEAYVSRLLLCLSVLAHLAFSAGEPQQLLPVAVLRQ